MGLFNIKSNFSQLPITYKDRVVVLIGLKPKGTINNEFAPGKCFVPISVPIRGTYDECGGIKDIDYTPGIEVLENFFGMNTVGIIDTIKLTLCGGKCYRFEELIKDILEHKINIDLYPNLDFEFSFVIEHEHIFDYMVGISNYKVVKDGEPYLEYIFKKNIKDLNPEYIRNNVRESLPDATEKQIDAVMNAHSIEMLNFIYGKKELYEYSFIRKETIYNSIFAIREGLGYNDLILCSFGYGEEHLKIEYMKEIIEVACFIETLIHLNISWGENCYYLYQDVSYDKHIDFLKECLSLTKVKKDEYLLKYSEDE